MLKRSPSANGQQRQQPVFRRTSESIALHAVRKGCLMFAATPVSSARDSPFTNATTCAVRLVVVPGSVTSPNSLVAMANRSLRSIYPVKACQIRWALTLFASKVTC